MKCGQSHMQINGGKLVLQPETCAGSELPMTSFDVTPFGRAVVKVVCSR